MKKYNRDIPKEVNPTSSFHDLTKFLIYSYKVENQSIVEDILVEREKGLKDEVQRLREECEVLEESSRIGIELLRERHEKELKRERDLCESMVGWERVEKEKMEEKLRSEKGLKDEVKKVVEECGSLRMELELLGEKYEKELECERGLCERKVSVAEMEKEKLRVEFDEKAKILEEVVVKREKDLGDEIVRREEAERERDLLVKKMSLVEKEKWEVVERLRKELEGRIEELEGENRELRNKIEMNNKTFCREFVIEEERLKGKYEELVRNYDMMKNKHCLRVSEKLQLEKELKRSMVQIEEARKEFKGELEKARKELEGRIEELEGENRELRNKVELNNETLGKEFAMVEEGLAKLKGVFGCGNAEIDRASGNDYHGRVVSMTDAHYKAKTESSFLECEAGDGGCSENKINRKRKRSINETEDDKDSTTFNKNIECLLESGCKKISCPVDFFRKVDPDAPEDSKANAPSKFSSTWVKQCKDENARHQNSELHFTTPFSNVVEETNGYSGGNPHEASPANRAVAGFQSDKEISWKHEVDMLSAFWNDPELCLAAVCALYRQSIPVRLSNSLGFSSIDSVRGTAIAKYLINNDPENKLSRSLLEVQQKGVTMLRSCQALATQYSQQLFTIYQKKLDPFFCPKS